MAEVVNGAGKAWSNPWLYALNEHWFTSLAQARQLIAVWRRDYNEVRPHSSCGRIPPAQFAANHRAQHASNAATFNPGLYQ